MRVSRYVTTFRSGSSTPYVYNALSNRLFRVSERVFGYLNPSRSPNSVSSDIPAEIASQFPDSLMFQSNEQEMRELGSRQNSRDIACAADGHVDLSICPTLNCNFECGYCFENGHRSTDRMSEKTADNIVAFAESIEGARTISVTWYGGEPLLGFSIIQRITADLKRSNLYFDGAGLVTNGYLLTREKIAELEYLNIKWIQVTLDGPAVIHDSRRSLLNGRPTYDIIVNNIDELFRSSFSGSCRIRVNIDNDNLDTFVEFKRFILNRYHGANIQVYGGRVDVSGDSAHRCNNSCKNISADRWASHLMEQCRAYGLDAAEALYPIRDPINLCTATMRNSYVIGPHGELYKCWEDVGKDSCVIGNVNYRQFRQRPNLETAYAIVGNPFRDSQCLQCNAMPICGGGCANRRLRKLEFGDQDAEYCSLYKNHLVDFLQQVANKTERIRLCAALLDIAGLSTAADVEEVNVRIGLRGSEVCSDIGLQRKSDSGRIPPTGW